MIIGYKLFDGQTLGSDKVGESNGEGEERIGIFQHPRTSLHPSQTSCLNQERNQVRSHVRSLIPRLSQNQSISILSFVGRMVIRRSFVTRERER
jgi:hypothetical protein